jgi:hypothetical protein
MPQKTPEEILTLLDQAQSLIDGWTETYVATSNIPVIDLRDLVWDVIDDILSSLAIALDGSYIFVYDEIYNQVQDYVTNHYGKD